MGKNWFDKGKTGQGKGKRGFDKCSPGFVKGYMGSAWLAQVMDFDGTKFFHHHFVKIAQLMNISTSDGLF